MRKTVLLLSICIAFVFSGCKTDPKKSADSSVTETPIPVEKTQQLVLPSDSGIVKIDLSNGKGTVRTQKKEDQTIYFEFVSKGYKTLYARLSSQDSLANIRFSQIFMPDGTMDGPFGRDMQYTLPSDGLYRISVHENMMAGDPWGGIFTVDVQLTK